MKQTDIRTSFHKLIDEIDNDNLLMKFYDLLNKSSDQKEGELWNQLSDEQKNEILLAESESHYEKNLIDQDTQKEKHKKWL
jgi:hypothetical protein